jgi:transcription initiation factor TFIIIB Brf1 subunit/transcription initiation factor TFIIB
MDDLSSIWKQYEKFAQEPPPEEHDPNHINFITCLQCNALHSLRRDPQNGTRLCVECGCVAESGCIDDTPEWSFGGGDQCREDPSRVGVPIDPLLEKCSLSTIITGKPKNCFMLRLHNQMSMNYVERARYHVFVNITRMASEKGHLKPNVVEQAKYYYMILSGRKLSRGAIRKGLVACCIMYACKNMNVSRSVKEIATMTGVPVAILNKTTKIFLDHMNDILVQTESQRDVSEKARYCDYVFRATCSKDLLLRYCNMLHISHIPTAKKLVQMTKSVNDDVIRFKLAECKTPSAIVSGIIHYSINKLGIENFPKSKLSRMFDVSVVTINKIDQIITSYYSMSTT